MASRNMPPDDRTVPTQPSSGERGNGWAVAAGASVALLGSLIAGGLTFLFFTVYGLQLPPPKRSYVPAALLGLLHLALAAGCLIGGRRLMAQGRHRVGLGLMIGWLVGFLISVAFLLAIRVLLSMIDLT